MTAAPAGTPRESAAGSRRSSSVRGREGRVHIRSLAIKNCKLMKSFEVDFMRGSVPRPWTVFVGENGLCKTTILQAIALAASGPDKSNQVAGDLPVRLPDRRAPDETCGIGAQFASARVALETS